jgi:hypothetical protein
MATLGEEAAGGGILARFETDNPYLQKVFAHELFASGPDGCGELLAQLGTVAPGERVIAAMRVRHGAMEGGVLMVTTHWLRYVKQGRLFTAIANDEFWSLDGSLELEATLGGQVLFRTPDGSQFQIFPNIPMASRKKAKAFLEIYKLLVLAGAHWQQQEEEAALDGMAQSGQSMSGPAAELKELVAMRESGALSESEFESAKARVLGS